MTPAERQKRYRDKKRREREARSRSASGSSGARPTWTASERSGRW